MSAEVLESFPKRKDLRKQPGSGVTKPLSKDSIAEDSIQQSFRETSSPAIAYPSRRSVRESHQPRRATKTPGAAFGILSPGGSPTTVRAAQGGSIAVAALGLTLAVVIPSTQTPVLTAAVPEASPATQPSLSAVSADKDAAVYFDDVNGASKPDPEAKLKGAIAVSADRAAPAQAKGAFAPPLKQMQVVSPFGNRLNPLTGSPGEFHTGQDLVAQCATAVYAAAAGTVKSAGWVNTGGGNQVEIDHGNGLSSLYMHNSEVKVKPGQKVNRGDLVALSGTTGASTGCHVHFQVEINNKPVDPANWL